MLAISFMLSATLHRIISDIAPSNRVIRWLRAATDRQRAIVRGSALAGTYLAAAAACSAITQADGPGWGNLLVLLSIWNAMKSGWLTVFLTVRRRIEPRLSTD